jgi:hypothetical protein
MQVAQQWSRRPGTVIVDVFISLTAVNERMRIVVRVVVVVKRTASPGVIRILDLTDVSPLNPMRSSVLF